MEKADASIQEPCGLCGSQSNLLKSHFMPSFIFRWMKDTSVTGHIRFAENPNKRTQDGFKIPFLCQDCEELFNKFETPFATRIFHPYAAERTLPLAFEQWMLKFCCSLSWRAMNFVRLKGGLQSLSHDEEQDLLLAEKRWKDFLLGRQPNPGIYEQHLLPLDLIDSVTNTDMPTNINRYLTRAVEFDVVFGTHTGFTYTKFGPFALMGFLREPLEKWEGTKVPVRFGSLRARQYVLPKNLMNYFFDRARNYASVSERMSERQHGIVDQTVRADLERARNSDQLNAMLQDAKLFGDHVVIRKPNNSD